MQLTEETRVRGRNRWPRHNPAGQHFVFTVIRGSPAPPEASHQVDLDGCVVRSSRRHVWRFVHGVLLTQKGREALVSFDE